MGANGASGRELQIAPKNRFHTKMFKENYGLITSYFHPIFIAVLHEMYWIYYSYINKDRKTSFRDLASKVPRNYACIAPILKAGCIRIPKWCRAPDLCTIPWCYGFVWGLSNTVSMDAARTPRMHSTHTLEIVLNLVALFFKVLQVKNWFRVSSCKSEFTWDQFRLLHVSTCELAAPYIYSCIRSCEWGASEVCVRGYLQVGGRFNAPGGGPGRLY
jgi:hypothetical protein